MPIVRACVRCSISARELARFKLAFLSSSSVNSCIFCLNNSESLTKPSAIKAFSNSLMACSFLTAASLPSSSDLANCWLASTIPLAWR
ncbi:hypothetical protein ACMHUM_14275 [Proteus mirabilis]